MKKFIITALSLLFSVPAAFSADSTFIFDYDYNLLKGTQNKAILELYYSFYKRGLQYEFKDGSYSAQPMLDVRILSSSKSDTVFNNSFIIPTVVNDTSQTNLESSVLGQINLQIQPGNYVLQIRGTDNLKTSNNVFIEQDIAVRDFSSDLNLSEIQLSSSISKSTDKTSIFYKNTLEVVPNPSRLFGNNINSVFYYYEIYGIDQVKYPKILVRTKITDLNKENEFITKEKWLTPSAASIVDMGSFKTDSLFTSQYLVSVQLYDQQNNMLASREKKFVVYNTNSIVNVDDLKSNDYLKSEYRTMREELVNKEYEITLYIRTAAESAAWNTITSLEDKRKFMFDFWKRRDIISNTPQNEFKIEYVKRVIEASKLFQEYMMEGWKTERGRIYVEYGKPEEIEKHTFEAENKNHEIWKYEKAEGGATCVFIERAPSGSGVYYLAHSTFKKEIKNPSWETEIKE